MEGEGLTVNSTHTYLNKQLGNNDLYLQIKL